jgi:uncharacterized membrane protein YhhN
VDLLSLAVGYDPAHTVTKPLLMPLLAAYAALRGAPRLLVAALLFGWGGDTLLLSDADPAFLAGMACFAAGHLCYLALFRTYGGPKRAPRARAGLLVAGYAVALAATVTLLWPDLPADLRVPVAGYSALLTAMAVPRPPGSASSPGSAGRSSWSPTPSSRPASPTGRSRPGPTSGSC